MATVGHILSTLLRPKQLWQQLLFDRWTDIVGELATRMRIERVTSDTVTIGVYDVHWMHELYYLSGDLKARINDQLDEPHVKHVRFVLAKKRHGAGVEEQKNERVPHKKQTGRALSMYEQRALQHVHDEQLQSLLRNLMERSNV